MLYALPLSGRTLVSGLAALALVLGGSVCACAGSSEQSRSAPCFSGESHGAASPSGCEPVHTDTECSHCEQPGDQTAKIERAADGHSGSSAPVAILPVAELVVAKARIRPLGSINNLPPPRSSSDLLSRICKLRI